MTPIPTADWLAAVVPKASELLKMNAVKRGSRRRDTTATQVAGLTETMELLFPGALLLLLLLRSPGTRITRRRQAGPTARVRTS